MSDNLTYPEEAMRQARARIEALEAEKREYAAKYMAAAGQAGDALERADAAEAKLREAEDRAWNAAIREAARLVYERVGDKIDKQAQDGISAVGAFSQEVQNHQRQFVAGMRLGRIAAVNAIRTLARLAGETQDGEDDE